MICKQRDCPYFSEEKDVVLPDGNFNAPVVVIGEAPGANEQAEGRPFVGVSGKLLKKIF
jgi:DNA polymerase